MRRSDLAVVPVASGVVEPSGVLPALAAALEGTGPAFAPVPADSVETDRLTQALRPEQPLEDPATAVVLPTSGSTGEPKGVLLSATALRASAEATLERLGGPGGWLLALPITRIAGLQVLVRSLIGAPDRPPVALDGGFDAERFVAATRRLGSGRRYTALVPTQLRRLLNADTAAIDALTSYDAVLLGGAATPPGLLARCREVGVAVVRTYGMTETSGGCVYDGHPLRGVQVAIDPPREGPTQADSWQDNPAQHAGPETASAAGARTVPSNTLTVAAGPVGATGPGATGPGATGPGPAGTVVGRVRLAGPQLFSGYRLRPDLTSEALAGGWHRTSDLGQLHDDGRLEILGRVDDVVISGGVNVPLLVVERALSTFPGLREVAAAGAADPEWGERVVAHVVVAPGTAMPSVQDLREHVMAEHPRPYAPSQVVAWPELPQLPSGKLDREALKVAGQDR